MQSVDSDNKIISTDLKPALYLLPVTLSDNSNPTDVLARYNLEIFCKIKHFVVENLRTARRFLKKVDKNINIDSLTFIELSEHTSERDIPAMLDPVYSGEPVGVMSEAGCPAVADPGARLVAIAQQRGIPVIPLVGPSSILLSLMASGFNGQGFTFNGYLPIEEKSRDNTLRNLAATVRKNNITQIFIEAPYRNNRLIARMLEILPAETKLCIASDITGPRQSIVTQTIAHWKRQQFDYDKIPTIFLLGS